MALSETSIPSNGKDSTFYPKITHHISEIVQRLWYLNYDEANPTKKITLAPIPIIGTVKLHGTHADILIYNDSTIVFQSRNVARLSMTKDNQGFATNMTSKKKSLLRLRDLYVSRWRELNPEAMLNPSQPVLIAGEWIGAKIQKDVAIAELSRRFVIISVNINGTWQNDSLYAGISLPNHGIYNISRAGFYNATLYPEDIQRTTADLEPLAEQVAASCPFASTFGVEGFGEGIVWKLDASPYNADASLWFKTKGGQFKPTFARRPKKTLSFGTIEEKRQQAEEVAKVWCSDQRLEQGWDVLREKGIERDVKGLTEYLKWVQVDILTEERQYIKDYGVGAGTLKIEIGKIAKPWYLERIERELSEAAESLSLT